jgi:hypothetical protein
MTAVAVSARLKIVVADCPRLTSSAWSALLLLEPNVDASHQPTLRVDLPDVACTHDAEDHSWLDLLD